MPTIVVVDDVSARCRLVCVCVCLQPLIRALVAHWSAHGALSLTQRRVAASERLALAFARADEPLFVASRYIVAAAAAASSRDDSSWPAALDDVEQWRRLQLALLRTMVNTLRRHADDGSNAAAARNPALVVALERTLATASALRLDDAGVSAALVAWCVACMRAASSPNCVSLCVRGRINFQTLRGEWFARLVVADCVSV